ncbi:MAG TPA: tetratricopeptide repeat protein [Anaeromyxobacteraceae bacterium]|nr:tetratricopeptide repeat protein [Anaeromyxobacteraceae bacterium]
MEQRILRLEEENQLMARQLEEQRAVIAERVNEVQTKLSELNTTAHRTGADVVARQDQMQDELRKLSGSLEEERHRLASVDEALSSMQKRVDDVESVLRGSGALAQADLRRKLEAIQRPDGPAGYVGLAREQQQAGETAVARALYDELTRKWPTAPEAAEAWFQLGSIAANDQRHRDAILMFGKVAQEFPKSERAPEAMLRTGDALRAMNMRQDAIGVFSEIPKRYPRTPAAAEAQQRLKELAPPKAPAKAPAKKTGR